MKAYLFSLGCKVNSYEESAARRLLRDRGYEIAERPEEADLVYLNTCAVTSEGERKSRQKAASLRRVCPDAVLVVAGCASQDEPEKFAELGADYVYGTYPKYAFLDRLDGRRPQKPVILVGKPRDYHVYEEAGHAVCGDRARAYLKIEDGCDAFCAYCLVPYLRGPVRSREKALVLKEAGALYGQGYREIVLTGIHLGLYGKDRGEKGLGGLVEDLLEALPADARIRLGSLESSEVDEGILSSLKNGEGRLCPHFHMPLQSGSEKTLLRMGRPYPAVEYLKKAELIRAAFPGAAIAADFIAGFPGETDDDFKNSLDFVKKAKISFLHAFPYSPRPGTRAAVMPGQVPAATRKERTKEAIRVGDELTEEYLSSLDGLGDSVLVEKIADGVGYGHSGRFAYCAVKGGHLVRGKLENGIYGRNLTVFKPKQ